MAKFTYRFHRDAWTDITVEADSRDEALEIAMNRYNEGDYEDSDEDFENTNVDLIERSDAGFDDIPDMPEEFEGCDWLTLGIEMPDGYEKEVHGYMNSCHLKDEAVPEGYYKYDLRETDDLDGWIATIERTVLVNHFGTFLTKEKIDLGERGWLKVTYQDFDPWRE